MQKNQIKRILPKVSSCPTFHVEIDKSTNGMSLSVSGVKRVSEFSDTLVRLRLSTFFLLIVGKDLSITVFESKKVDIIGKISEVKFGYGKA